jgi:lauroyl/myristoyl acyltransferase
MHSSNKKINYRSETISSPSLFLKEFTAQEEVDSRKKQPFGGTRIKSIILPKLHWLLLHSHVFIAIAPVRLTILLLRGLYWWPQNPWRLSSEYICKIAHKAGHPHQAKQVYQQLMTNLLGAAENYAHLYGSGLDSVLDRVQLASAEAARINQLIEEYGGVLLMVPHNFGTTFSVPEMHRTIPLLVVVRNPATIERTKVAIDFYERMQIKIIMVRGGNPFKLSRTLFSVLKTGKAIVATVDSLERSENRIEVNMFNTRIGFNPWAAKIGARLKLPIVPCYFKSRGRHISVVPGPSLISNDVSELIQHYIGFFEQNIVEDPASWAFLADKNWIKVLRKVSFRLDNA